MSPAGTSIRRACQIGGGAIVLVQLLRAPLANTAARHAVADWLLRVAG